MKLLFCEICGDIIAPYRRPMLPRFCGCKRHAVWWTEPRAGILRVNDTREPAGRMPRRPKVYVLGITNLLLSCPLQSLDASVITDIIDAHEDHYLFRRWRSPIIRIRPGESNDTGWAPIPDGEHENGWPEVTEAMVAAGAFAEWREQNGSGARHPTEIRLIEAMKALSTMLDRIDAIEAKKGSKDAAVE